MIRATILLITLAAALFSCVKNSKPYPDFYNQIKEGSVFSNYGGVFIGRLKIYIETEKESRFSHMEISHFCSIYLESDQFKTTAKIAKHGLFFIGINSPQKSLTIKKISCPWRENQEVRFLDLDLKIDGLRKDKINYFGDFSLFISNKIKTRKTIKNCTSSKKCKEIAIIYPEKITKENLANKTYEDIRKISELPLSIEHLSTTKVISQNPEMPKISEQNNNIAF